MTKQYGEAQSWLVFCLTTVVRFADAVTNYFEEILLSCCDSNEMSQLDVLVLAI